MHAKLKKDNLGFTFSLVATSVGLDPADPYFQGTDVRVRLDPSDAAFVDVIHTDGSNILQLGFGTMQQMGHVDFYPNGGVHQPGCDADFMGKLSHTVWAAVTQLDTLGIKLDQKFLELLSKHFQREVLI